MGADDAPRSVAGACAVWTGPSRRSAPPTTRRCSWGQVQPAHLEGGELQLRFTNAAHPPPLLVDPGGQVREVSGDTDLPLGVLPEAARSDVVVALPPGGTLLLYTDGLFDHREESLTAGLARLRKPAG